MTVEKILSRHSLWHFFGLADLLLRIIWIIKTLRQCYNKGDDIVNVLLGLISSGDGLKIQNIATHRTQGCRKRQLREQIKQDYIIAKRRKT